MSDPVTLPTFEEMIRDASSLLGAVWRGHFEGYKRRYRAFVVSKIAARRDSYDPKTPEWRALDQLLKDLGAAQRDPAVTPPEMPEERSAA